MEIRNSDSRELCGDDGGFALTGVTTLDGDKVAKAKRDVTKGRKAPWILQKNTKNIAP